MNTEELVCAYAAGLFDGEGCITLRVRRSGYIAMEVRVTNTNREIIEWLRDQFGGTIYGQRQPKGNRREAFCWRLSEITGSNFLRLILPFLRIKREEAHVALAYREYIEARKARPHPAGKKLTVEDITIRRSFRDQIHALRKQGHVQRVNPPIVPDSA